MANEGISHIDKFIPNLSHTKEVKDLDTQIDKTTNLEKSENFKKIYAQRLEEQSVGIGQVQEGVQIRRTMQEVEASYAAMMEIHREIQEAYEQVQQMRQI